MLLKRRALSGVTLVALVIGHAETSGADPAACITASERGQSLTLAHHPVAAQAEYVKCAAEACPGPIAKDCAERLARGEASIASIVPMAQGAADVGAARVLMDGELLAAHIDGRAIAVDPGPHTFRFELGDGRATDMKVIVEEGVRAKPVSVAFPPRTSEPPSPVRHRPLSPWAYVLGGVGLAAIGVGAGFGVEAIVEHDQLHTPSEVTTFHTNQALSDVGFGVGVLALGVATWIVLAHRGEPGQGQAWAPAILVW